MRDRFFSRFLVGREPIRALYLLPSLDFGGLERQVSCVLPQMSAWGVEVTALVGPGSRLVSWLEGEGVKDVVHTQDFPCPERAAGWGAVLQLGGACRGALRLGEEIERLIHERAIDVVVAAGPLAWLAAHEPVCRFQVPVAWWALDVPAAGEKVLARTLAALRRPDLLLCASEELEAVWAPAVRAPSEVVKGAVDLNRFRRGRGDPGRFRPGGAAPVVGFAGRLTSEKHAADFVAMAGRLRTRAPEARFLVAGEGPERAACERLARELGLADRCWFLGYVDDMYSFYAACDLLVLPSEQARPAQAVLEALAMQIPVVTTDRVARAGGLPEQACPVGDVGALTEAVSRLLAGPGLRTSAVLRAHDRVRREFDAQRTARRTARLLHTLVAWSGATAAPAQPVRRRLELAT